VTNAATVGTNLSIKKIKRLGHGFRNFENYRLRLLLHCGVSWKRRAVTPMRARQQCWSRRARSPRDVFCSSGRAVAV
jgi:hypothetical protein